MHWSQHRKYEYKFDNSYKEAAATKHGRMDKKDWERERERESEATTNE